MTPSPWIPCSERLPELGEYAWIYLTDDHKEPRCTVARRIETGKIREGESEIGWECAPEPHDWGPWLYKHEVTHWMPLPEPPS
jgi:hypothetical protein